MDFAVERSATPAHTLIAVSGEVDVVTSPRLQEALEDALAGDKPVVVDFGNVTFLDSSGLAALIAAQERSDELSNRMVLRALPPRVRKLLAITRLDEEFTVEPD